MIKGVVGGEKLWGHCTDWLDSVYYGEVSQELSALKSILKKEEGKREKYKIDRREGKACAYIVVGACQSRKWGWWRVPGLAAKEQLAIWPDNVVRHERGGGVCI